MYGLQSFVHANCKRKCSVIILKALVDVLIGQLKQVDKLWLEFDVKSKEK